MSKEPDFIAQTAEPMTRSQRTEWWRQQVTAAHEKGITWSRFSIHPERREITLYEGWKGRPDDEGEPRFQMQAIR